MREYGTVSPQFWIGETGKSLRGNLEAQIVALYLMTSPHANMIGVFYCPTDYIAKETGLAIEGASKGLARLIEGEFCRVDGVTEEVFVMRMAAFQIGEQLSPKDKRCIGVARELEKVSSSKLRQGFHAIYSGAFHLPKLGKKLSPLDAPSKPGAGTGAGTGSIKSGGERFDEFWLTWPKNDRKQDKAKCLDKWKAEGLDAVADAIVADVKAKRGTTKWREGYIEAPSVYLNNRRWEDGGTGSGAGDWWLSAGFSDRFEAENHGCKAGNANQFRDGKKIEVAA